MFSLALRPFGRPLATLAVLAAFAGCHDDSTVEGEAAPATAAEIDRLVDDYLLSRASGKADHDTNMCLPPVDPKACADAACELLGSFGCDSQEEVLPVLKACRGNHGADCLTSTCALLGSFGCDSRDEILPVLESCRGVVDTSCVQSACELLGSFGCDSDEELLPVVDSCRGSVDGDCVAFVCEQLGSFGCDSWEELEPVLESCSGRPSHPHPHPHPHPHGDQ